MFGLLVMACRVLVALPSSIILITNNLGLGISLLCPSLYLLLFCALYQLPSTFIARSSACSLVEVLDLLIDLLCRCFLALTCA